MIKVRVTKPVALKACAAPEQQVLNKKDNRCHFNSRHEGGWRGLNLTRPWKNRSRHFTSRHNQVNSMVGRPATSLALRPLLVWLM